MVNDLCLMCYRRPKRKAHQFCSPDCTKASAARAPSLLYIPPDHVMYQNVYNSFRENWEDPNPIPQILCMFLITWTSELRSSFDNYREKVEKETGLDNGFERKRFRAERRACNLGEPGHDTLCNRSDCALCKAIRTGFRSSLQHKRNLVGDVGVRLGRGVYCTPTSSKAYEYAKNTHHQSSVKAIIDARVVLGKRYVTKRENHSLRSAPRGYHSVIGATGADSEFPDTECVVYDENSIRPSYLIMIQD